MQARSCFAVRLSKPLDDRTGRAVGHGDIGDLPCHAGGLDEDHELHRLAGTRVEPAVVEQGVDIGLEIGAVTEAFHGVFRAALFADRRERDAPGAAGAAERFEQRGVGGLGFREAVICHQGVKNLPGGESARIGREHRVNLLEQCARSRLRPPLSDEAARARRRGCDDAIGGHCQPPGPARVILCLEVGRDVADPIVARRRREPGVEATAMQAGVPGAVRTFGVGAGLAAVGAGVGAVILRWPPFFRLGMCSAVCVRTVRIGPAIEFQWIGADGLDRLVRPTVRIVGDRLQVGGREAIGLTGFRPWRGRCGRCGRLRPACFRRWIGVRRGDADDPGPRPAFALEADLDADLAQEGRRPAQPARQRPRTMRPGLGLVDALARQFPKGAQKVRGGSRPLRPRVIMARTAAAIGSASITPSTASSRLPQ